jgi:SSS family solute:Na+ symporter
MFTAIPLYLFATIAIGWRFRHLRSTSNDYLNASRSLPTWAAALSFLAYNCGSLEVLGMSAMAAQYGVQALHFYWIGGIPGLVFMAVIVLPIYMRTGAHSLPEYLEMRFGPDTRMTSAYISMASTAALSGAALYALAQVLHVVVGMSLLSGALASASVVLIYVLIGGIRATIYASIFQLFVMIGGLTPLFYMTVRFTAASFAVRSDRWHLWKQLPLLSPNATLDRIGVALGLGFVISFAYWCTDFVMIQRALTARTIEAARRVPLLAGFGKLGIGLLIVLPGVAAPALLHERVSSFDETMPNLMLFAFGPGLLALGTVALLASLMVGLAGNVNGFSALWTEEIYRNRFGRNRSEQHYILVGRATVVACFLLALVGAYAAFRFHDLMEYLQLILALFYAPVFAILLAGVAGKRATERGAQRGILVGVTAATALQLGYWAGWVHFGSQMAANFYTAIMSFSIATLGCLLFISRKEDKPKSERKEPVINASVLEAIRPSLALAVMSVLLLLFCLLLNLLWW